jgi:hypothetical protein
MRPCSESEHYHHCLAESSRHEIIVALFNFLRAPEADGCHAEQIQSQHKNIRNMQSKHSIDPYKSDFNKASLESDFRKLSIEY